MPWHSRYWLSLVASAGAHAAVAAALTSTPGSAERSPPARPETRDIWIGDTLETASATSNSDENGAEHAETPPHTRVSAPAPAQKLVTVERSVRSVRAPEASTPADREAALAERILAYEPRSSSARSNDRGPSSAEPARGVTGGMDGRREDVRARGFAKAFTRALPAANTGDPVWGQLPLGAVGFVRVSVTVDEDGTITESKVWNEPQQPPSHLARLVDRTLIMLQGGRFALEKAPKGRETLRIDVTLSERPMESGPLALGFEAPTSESAGRAYFQLASGRLVDAKVTIEPK